MPRGRKKSAEPKEEKSYSVCDEAEALVKKLVDRYPKILWAVNPKEVAVFGIDNAERSSSNKALAKIRAVDGIYKALLLKNNIGTKYLIEMYWSDWHDWDQNTKQWIILHELLHIPGPDEKGLIKHDVQDFALAVDVVGVDGYEDGKALPNLLEGELVKFREELMTKLHLKKEDVEAEDDAPTPPEE